jgi:hypothetical protein
MSGVLNNCAFATVAAVALLSLPSAADDAKPNEPAAATRSPHVQLAIELPEARGPWRMVLHNQDTVPVRVVADARRLTLLIRGQDDNTYTQCRLPSSMQGSIRARQLVLKPGDKYVERFDPRMYCWGSISEKLTAGASVTAFLGWEPNARLEKRNKPQVLPFAAEPVLAPAAFVSQKRLASLTQWLPSNDVVEANPETPQPPPKFVGAPDLRLSTHRWADATTYRDARLTATLTNVGDRAALLHLRPDDLEVRVRLPNGSMTVCGPGSDRRAAVRDFFQTIKPGRSASVGILLTELCSSDVLARPGLYELTATLRVRDDGSEFRLDAVTGDFAVRRSTLLRVRKSREPFHARPPRREGGHHRKHR